MTKLRLLALTTLCSTVLLGISATGLAHAQAPDTAQDPPGVPEALAGLCSQHADRTSITFDRQMLDALLGGDHTAGFNSITFENFHFAEPAFYIPEAMHAMDADFRTAGWKHLVEANASPRESASPTKPLSDIWFHFAGGEIDHVTVLIRGHREMNVIHVSGLLRPLDLVHLGGHFGIPKVDPSAVMVPAP